ncbi:MAG: TIGR02449 family protein [Cellvibrionaceae bacterium]|nr:TIGR02449 family protein [Cellvibrionaceae bacterium]
MNEHILQQIETKTDELISRVQKLEQENAELKAQQATWNEEKARLIEKNEAALSQVEAMIERLKVIDTDNGAT